MNAERRFFWIVLAGTTALSFWLLRPYFGAIALSLLLGLLFYPQHARYEKLFGKRRWLSLTATFTTVVLTFLVPFVLVIGLIARVASDFASKVSTSGLTNQLSIDWLVARVNGLAGRIPGIEWNITSEQVVDRLQTSASSIGDSLLGNLSTIGGSLITVIPAIFLLIYIMGAVFTNYHAMSAYMHKLSPLNNELDRLYVNRIKSMTISMVRGTLVIALIQGFLTALFLMIAGVQYAAFFGLLATVASIIPLGAGVIAIPIGVLLILTGNIWQGVLQIAGNLIIVANVDNFLRPKLVSREAALHPALVLLGLFAGLWHFGFLGAIYGPVLMIFIVTTIEIYQKHFTE